MKLNDSFSKCIKAHVDDYEGKLLQIIEITCFNFANVDLFWMCIWPKKVDN